MVHESTPSHPRHFATEVSVPEEWRVGDVLLELYEVLGIHADGGMGVVYRVHHRTWDLDLAVKSPNAKYLQTAEGRKSFVHEAEVWTDLGFHPHIVTCYYVRTLAGIPRVFAEYVEGGSLKDWIIQGRVYRSQPLAQILDIAIQTCWGLAFAHRRNLVHQDIKPANILLTTQGVAKINDFGLARQQRFASIDSNDQGPPSPSATRLGGTPAYWSPEQSDSTKRVTPESDVWSWALSMLEVFTGGLSWSSGVLGPAVLAQVRDQMYEGQRLALPSDIALLFEQCLATDPAARPSMEQVSASLVKMYQTHIGRPYHRTLAFTEKNIADNLNNRAVTDLDLGRQSQAVQHLDCAIQQSPSHGLANYNRIRLRWLSGEITCDELKQLALELPVSMERILAQTWLLIESGDVGLAQANVRKLLDANIPCAAIEKVIRVGMRPTTTVQFSAKVQTITCLPEINCARFVLSDGSVVTFNVLSGDQRFIVGSGIGRATDSALCSENGSLLVGDVSGRILLVSSRHEQTMVLPAQHDDPVVAVAIAERLPVAVTVDRDSISVWNVTEQQRIAHRSGFCRRKVTGMDADLNAHVRVFPIVGSAIAPNGEVIATARVQSLTESVIEVWSTKLEQRKSILVKNEALTTIQWTHDDSYVMSGHRDGSVRFWNALSGECMKTVRAHQSVVKRIRRVGVWAVSFDKHEVVLWNLPKQQCIRRLRCAHEITDATVFIERTCIIVATDRSIVIHPLAVWGSAPALLVRPVTTGELAEAAVRFDQLITKADQSIAQSDWRELASSLAQASSVKGFEESLEILSRACVLSKHADRGVLKRAWLSSVLPAQSTKVSAIAVSVDGMRLAVGNMSGRLKVLQTDTGREFFDQSIVDSAIHSLAISHDGNTAFLAGNDRVAELFSVDKKQRIWRLMHQSAVLGVTATPTFHYGVTAEASGKINIWDLQRKRRICVCEHGQNPIQAVAISWDGRTAVSSSDDGVVMVWNALSGECAQSLLGMPGVVRSLMITPDGRTIIATGDKGHILVWDHSSGQCVAHSQIHEGAAFAAVLPGVAPAIVSVGDDHIIRMSSLRSVGESMFVFEHTAGPCRSLAMCSHGMLGFLLSTNGSVHRWQFAWDWAYPASIQQETIQSLVLAFSHSPLALGNEGKMNTEAFEQWLQWAGLGWISRGEQASLLASIPIDSSRERGARHSWFTRLKSRLWSKY